MPTCRHIDAAVRTLLAKRDGTLGTDEGEETAPALYPTQIPLRQYSSAIDAEADGEGRASKIVVTLSYQQPDDHGAQHGAQHDDDADANALDQIQPHTQLQRWLDCPEHGAHRKVWPHIVMNCIIMIIIIML